MPTRILQILTAVLLIAVETSAAAPLTRAEIMERIKAPPATMCDGLLQVRAHLSCPPEMRREYQLPIAGYLADVCRALYAAQNVRPQRFERAALVVTIGGVVTNDATVAARVSKRDDGSSCLRVWVPAPGYADIRRLQLMAVRGWFLGVKGVDLSETDAWNAYLDSHPATRIQAEVDDLVAWRTEGVYTRGRSDEDYLRLRRKVLKPGFATREEVLTFAARLVLYPAYQDCPFRGRYDQLEFREAVNLAKDDLLVRIAALKKADELIVWGGGRGEELAAAADAYSNFLRALAGGKTEMTELDRMLDDADRKLKEAMP